jgi:hypothetical protein
MHQLPFDALFHFLMLSHLAINDVYIIVPTSKALLLPYDPGVH